MTALKNKGYIYKVTNIITGQFYIGQRSSYTGAPEDDLGVHYFTSSKVVRPLFKSNTSEWQKEILYRDIQYSETLDDMEGYAIHKVIMDPLCENRYDPTIRPGWSMAGKHHSLETRAKLRGRHFSAEHRAKLSEAEKHRPSISEVTRAKMSVSRRGKHIGPMSEEHKAKLREAWKNRAPMSAETRVKISESLKGRPCSAETRAKLSTANKNRGPMSEETRAKMSASAKRRHIRQLKEQSCHAN